MDYIVLTYPGGSRRWDFQHDASGNLTRIDYPQPNASTPRPHVDFQYDSDSNIVNVWDLNGNRWNYTYVLNTSLGSYGTTGGSVVVWRVNPPVQGAAPQGNVDVNNNTEFAWSFVARNGFANFYRVCKIYNKYADPSSGAARTRIAEHWYENGTSTDTNNNPADPFFQNPIVQVTDPYDSASTFRCYETFAWRHSDATLTTYAGRNGQIWNYVYCTGTDVDGRGVLWKVIDPNGRVVIYNGYDANLRLISRVQAVATESAALGAGWKITNLYNNAAGDPTTVVEDASVELTQTGLNGWSKLGATRAMTTYKTFDAQGNLTSERTGTENPKTYSNYYLGRPQTITDPAGIATTCTYDGLGRKLTQVNPTPAGQITYTYDDLDRLVQTSVQTDLGTPTITSTTYDDCGNAIQFVDANGHIASTIYDSCNRILQVRTPVDSTSSHDIIVSNEYDVAGRKVAMVNGRGKRTTYGFDPRDKMVKVKYPDNTTRSWTFTPNGDVATSTNGLGKVTVNTYDIYNRLITVKYPDAGRQLSNTYRRDGLLTKAIDTQTGTVTNTYNDLGELLGVQQPVNTSAGSTTTVTYSYEASSGRRIGMAIKPNNGTAVMSWTYDYDAAYRLKTVYQGGSAIVWFSYYPNGALKTRMDGNKVRTDYTYSMQGWVKQIAHSSLINNQMAQQLLVAYTYDPAGNVLTYTTSPIGQQQYSISYGYDYSGQLTSEQRTGGPSALFTSNLYTYDANFNRTSIKRNNGSTINYSYTDNDRFVSGDGYSFSSYDADGNPLQVTVPGKGSATLTYDSLDKLKALVGFNGVSASYIYYPDGRRYSKTSSGGTVTPAVLTPPSTPSSITKYLYDGATMIAESNGTSFTRFYVPGVGYVANGAITYYRENAIGSNISTVDANGTTLSRTDYDAFGVEYSLQAGAKGNLRFGGSHGYYADDESGLDLLGERFYLPGLGRFLTQDPLGHKAGPNLYQYCRNNPLILVDPDGTNGLRIAIIIGADHDGRVNFGDWVFGLTMYTQIDHDGNIPILRFAPSVKEALAVCSHADDAILCGHGEYEVGHNYSGVLITGNKSDGILWNFQLEKALHGHPLNHLLLIACGQGADVYAFGWNKVTKHFFGFDNGISAWDVMTGQFNTGVQRHQKDGYKTHAWGSNPTPGAHVRHDNHNAGHH